MQPARKRGIYCQLGQLGDFLRPTVDGRNPAPPGMYETLQIMGYSPYQLVQDFFHQQYHILQEPEYIH